MLFVIKDKKLLENMNRFGKDPHCICLAAIKLDSVYKAKTEDDKNNPKIYLGEGEYKEKKSKKKKADQKKIVIHHSNKSDESDDESTE